MVQNVSIPRDDIRGDECWARNEKSYVNVAHNATAATGCQSSLPNLNRFQVRSQSMSGFHSHVDINEQQSTAVQTALMSCGLDVGEFALIYTSSDGNPNPAILSSPGLRYYSHYILNEQVCSNFTRSVLRSRSEIGLPSTDDTRSLSNFDSESGNQKPWESKLVSPSDCRIGDTRVDDSDEGRSPRSRKRARVRRLRQDSTEDPPALMAKTQPLIIGNDADVDRFYFIRFKDMQQSSCKVMGKAFVKLVEPRKQTHHPYTGGNDKAPSWWPPTRGENAVRHKEPDHLLKPERINLLVHILKMVIEPSERQNPTVQKLGLNVKKLEETTMEVMSNWFNDKEHPENLQKRKYLKEIFRIAKIQERYKRGEIDGTTSVHVMSGVENRGPDCSDDDDEAIAFMSDPETEGAEALPTGVQGIHSPESLVSPSLLQQSDNELRLPSQSLRQNIQRNPIPGATYDSQLYRLDTNTFQPTQQHISNLQDPSRRSYAQPGFNSPQSSISSQWSTSMMSSPGQNSMFFSPPSNSFTYLPPPQQQQQQVHPTHHSFEGLHIGGISGTRGFEAVHTYGNQQAQRPSNLPSSITYPSQTQPQPPYSYSQRGGMYIQQDNNLKNEEQLQRQT
ncbi:putative ydr124wp-like protein [Golovinomyces cichoracearum]|uniref:Putative ydr124wp-like protein n=1 Tax=Golovinomyces cichoracearum TaxID=62708 RepID=A0A420HJV1_9PEZI|nr:putative ydr124wp-like protein [Golovinomyces cichoracearum]